MCFALQMAAIYCTETHLSYFVCCQLTSHCLAKLFGAKCRNCLECFVHRLKTLQQFLNANKRSICMKFHYLSERTIENSDNFIERYWSFGKINICKQGVSLKTSVQLFFFFFKLVSQNENLYNNTCNFNSCRDSNWLVSEFEV